MRDREREMTVAWTRVVAVEVVRSGLAPGCTLKRQLTICLSAEHRVREKDKV